jgi:hypothetical protein
MGETDDEIWARYPWLKTLLWGEIWPLVVIMAAGGLFLAWAWLTW